MNRSILAAALLLACVATDPPGPTSDCRGGPPVEAASQRLLVVGSDYSSGTVALLDPATLDARCQVLPATGDTIARAVGPFLALLHRSAAQGMDNLTLFDLRGPSPRLVRQLGLLTAEERDRDPLRRPTANAHDLLLVGPGRAYVARFDLGSLAVLDLDAGTVTGTISLDALRGIAPRPNPDAMALVGDRVWVTLERLDDPTRPRQRGVIAVVDPAMDRVVGQIELGHANPIGPIVAAPGGMRRWVVTLGDYHVVGDGAVEQIDVETRTRVADLVTERDVQGNIDGLTVLDEHRILLKVAGALRADASFEETRLVEFDLRTRATRVWLRWSTWSPATPVVIPGGRVFVGDPGDRVHRRAAGVRVFTTRGEELTARPLVVGLPPYDLQLLPPSVEP